jgi:chemotaxis protein MotB
MAAVASRRREHFNAWPGYVDVLSTLLMVVIFVLMVFVIAQFFLSSALTGRDEALERLTRQVAELSDLLSLERQANSELRINVAELSAELQDSTAERDDLRRQLTVVIGERDAATSSLADVNSRLAAILDERNELAGSSEDIKSQLAIVIGERDSLAAQLADANNRLADADAQLQAAEENAVLVSRQLEDAYKSIEADKEKITALLGDIAALQSLRDEMAKKLLETSDRARQEIAAEKEISKEALLQVELLNRQLTALRQQLARLAVALEASEAEAEEKNIQIANLGQRLNAALASKVEELARYRSEFFGRLREVLGDRPDIQIVGDRFVFQSEVLFASGSADIGIDGQVQLARLATTLLQLTKEIPTDLDWILRVDGHTDRRPISSSAFPSNWELSTARAISVVRFLMAQGIPAQRLAATGFAEFRPLDDRDDEIAYRRNRRIEIKLDQR